MTTPSVPGTRGFGFDLPSGFVELPVTEAELSPESFASLRAQVAVAFGLAPEADEAQAAALGYATFGSMAGEEGADYAAVGVYRSPDQADRPIMVLVASVGMVSDHDHQDIAIAGLLEVHEAEGRGSVGTLALPAGPAVAVVTEEQNVLSIGEASAPVLQRQVAAWVPDPHGSTIAVVAVSTSSWRDWEHVCAFALDVFESLEWEPLDAGRTSR